VAKVTEAASQFRPGEPQPMRMTRTTAPSVSRMPRTWTARFSLSRTAMLAY